MSGGIFAFTEIKPFEILGLTHKFWTLHVDILCATWIAMGIIFVLIMIGRQFLYKDLNIVAAGYETIISLFIDLCTDSFKKFHYYYFAFITTLFSFTFFSSMVGVIPFVKEATMDLNTTLALALTSFLYVTYQKIRIHGVVGYLKEFIEPVFVLAPIHAVGEVSKIASMSFRLFGNILGGSIILMMILEVFSTFKIPVMFFMSIVLSIKAISTVLDVKNRAPKINTCISILLHIMFVMTWLQLFFGIIEGLIQSFVLTMLTTTYLAIGISDENDHKHTTDNAPLTTKDPS